jgi:hypothetical protein
MYLLYIFPPELHTLMNDFVVLTSLTHPRKILLVALQIEKKELGKAKELSAPLHISGFLFAYSSFLKIKAIRFFEVCADLHRNYKARSFVSQKVEIFITTDEKTSNPKYVEILKYIYKTI